MDLSKLFQAQKKLDQKINENKGLQGVNLLDEKIIALQVELGELANEWQMFKFWKSDPQPNTYKETECHACKGEAVFYVMNEREVCVYCSGEGVEEVSNPLLEEYADCLHFILSIGNDLDCSVSEPYLVRIKSPFKMFSNVFYDIACLSINTDNKQYKQFYFAELISEFTGLGKSLNFTWEQIEQAYYEKNEVNHKRQESGY